MLERTGIPAKKELDEITPSPERLKEGPVAIFECYREIPCDPCYYSCPVEAVEEFVDINDLPEVDFEKCTGCGQCIAACPGLAVFVVDFTHGEERGLIGLPYEFTPLPDEGETVTALNHAGEELGSAVVHRVRKNQETPVVWLEIEKDYLLQVRHFFRAEEETER